jgi:putative FmdB family regulatory protein
MPTYGYECKSCTHTFDVFQSMADEPLKNCPQCGKEIRRLINGGTGVIFKGSGFYVTDKKGGGSKPAPSGKPDSPDNKAPSSAKPESPAAPACPGCASANQAGGCPKAADT